MFFWSLTYILLVVYMVKYKTIGIPVIAMLGNFAWEFNLMMSYREDVFQILTLDGTIWCLLDVAVILAYLFNCIHEKKTQKILLFICGLIVYSLLMYVVFLPGEHRLILLASLFLDFIMASAFLLYVIDKRILPNNLAVVIGFSRMLGDLTAWFANPSHPVISFNGKIVFCYNLVYLIFLIRQNREYRKKAP